MYRLNIRVLPAALAAVLFTAGQPGPARAEITDCFDPADRSAPANGPSCGPMEQVTILAMAEDVIDVTGAVSVITAEALDEFKATDVQRVLRQAPGVSIQVEDGYGLRPNISIRGTPAERSSRITLLEDNILIAPAPYSAPSAYYFPTFGRINRVEVLKGPASITQGPYTMGGALNLISTPIPASSQGMLLGEYGSDDTWRAHGWYGGGNDKARFLAETHQWQSDGFQSIDRSDSDTGFEKSDYVAKLQFNNDPASSTRHFLDIKLQSSEEQSRQSYLGLTDADFRRDSKRRYGVSVEDEMDNEHSQVVLSWRMEFDNGANLTVTGYNNETERAWYKTEGIDFDGSENAQEFSRTSWARVVEAVNLDQSIGAVSARDMAAILDGADTAPGSIQLRNNSREYYSRGVQAAMDWELAGPNTRHTVQVGVRYHEDEEDRLQRNDTWQQRDGRLVLNDVGLLGNAGNRVQNAKAWSAFIHDRIEWNAWTFTPGLRFESIDLSRVDYDTSGEDPASRNPDNVKSVRSNEVDVWIPGIGLLFDFNDELRLVAGVHRGFSTPGNKPGVDPEESVNYELGLRWTSGRVALDVMGFYNDYENLVGVCTNSSGADCEPGDSFNGKGVSVPGIEVSFYAGLENDTGWAFPVNLTYTWMDAEFQDSFDSDFFGEVMKGDPVPYIPNQQARASLGAEFGKFAGYISYTFVDGVCTQAACGAFEKTEAAHLFDLGLHYRLNERWEIYGIGENLADEVYIAGRDPYGARPDKSRSFTMGVRFDF